ncbi:hypothetical protein [Flagellimonas sp. W118]|uniref:hypothetical protein n=1 Tax=Flagellimonas sp. W118 TaxID=3410791 RepID=UPI003BF4B51C
MNDKKFDLEDRFVELVASIALFCKGFPSDFSVNIANVTSSDSDMVRIVSRSF